MGSVWISKCHFGNSLLNHVEATEHTWTILCLENHRRTCTTSAPKSGITLSSSARLSWPQTKDGCIKLRCVHDLSLSPTLCVYGIRVIHAASCPSMSWKCAYVCVDRRVICWWRCGHTVILHVVCDKYYYCMPPALHLVSKIETLPVITVDSCAHFVQTSTPSVQLGIARSSKTQVSMTVETGLKNGSALPKSGKLWHWHWSNQTLGSS